jgi:hypothetical protein
MNYRAEEKEEEKIKHRDLLFCEEINGSLRKTAEEVHVVGFNLGFR